MKNRLIQPDFIKGLCIILMVYGHINCIGSLASIQNEIISIIYSFHMPLFLIISGFFFKLSKTPSNQISNIFKNVGIPYILFISIYLLGLVLVQKMNIPTSNTAPQSLIEFLERIFLHPIGGYWFLHSLLLMTISLISSHLILKKYNSDFLVLLSSLIILGALTYYDLILPRTIIYYLSGYILGIITTRDLKTSSIFIPLSLFFIFLLYLKNLYKVEFYEFIWVFLLMTFFWSTATLFEKTFLIKKISWLGKNTLIILVLHSFPIVVLKSISKYFLKMDSTGLSYSLVVTFLTLLFCLVSARILDKLNLSKYLFNKNCIYEK